MQADYEMNSETKNADSAYIRQESFHEKKRKREKLLTCKAEPFFLKFAIYGETIVE